MYGSHTDPLKLGVRERKENCENINHNSDIKNHKRKKLKKEQILIRKSEKKW